MIPRSASRKFYVQKADAKRRGIDFQFSLEDWWAWWQIDNRWANRGRGAGRFVMARFGDTGPYCAANVRCATYEENNAEVSREKRAAGVSRSHAERKAKGVRNHLAVRGAQHPRARQVITPAGTFESGWLAADHFGVTKEAIYWRIAHWPDYSWAESNRK